VTWANDPELQEMFSTEMVERSATLVAGAQAIVADEYNADVAGRMLREGHTIKGTARVMGFPALSVAGQLLEHTWRQLSQGDLKPSKKLGLALEDVAASLPEAANADPETGTSGLRDAIELLEAVLGVASEDSVVRRSRPAEPAVSPEPAEATVAEVAESDARMDGADDAPAAGETDGLLTAGDEPEAEQERPPPAAAPLVTAPRSASYSTPSPELGGLLSAVNDWASGQIVTVNAGRLYRIINDAAHMRLELEAVMQQLRAGVPALELKLSISALVDTAVSLEEEGLDLASVPVTGMTNPLPQLVRYLAKKLDKEIRFEVVGAEEISVDRHILDMVADPVRQLVVNAVRHGIEPQVARKKAGKPVTGSIMLTTSIKDRSLEIVVSDDGTGIDWNVVRVTANQMGLYEGATVDVAALTKVLFQHGFSTVVENELGGAGAGLGVAADAVESLLGRIELESQEGSGTTVTITVPTSRALQRIVIVEAAGTKWGLPEGMVTEILPIDAAGVDSVDDPHSVERNGTTIPVARLATSVGITSRSDVGSQLVILAGRAGSAAVTVDSVAGVRDVAAKELGALLSGPSHITGAALLGGGDVVLVLDAGAIVERVINPSIVEELPGEEDDGPWRVLVVDDSQGARVVVSGALASTGFITTVAASALEALDILHKEPQDALVVDFSMPQEDGVELVQRVRANNPNIPIIMLSGVATPEDQERATAAGVDVFFDKAHFREGALGDTLRHLLRQRKP